MSWKRLLLMCIGVALALPSVASAQVGGAGGSETGLSDADCVPVGEPAVRSLPSGLRRRLAPQSGYAR